MLLALPRLNCSPRPNVGPRPELLRQICGHARVLLCLLHVREGGEARERGRGNQLDPDDESGGIAMEEAGSAGLVLRQRKKER